MAGQLLGLGFRRTPLAAAAVLLVVAMAGTEWNLCWAGPASDLYKRFRVALPSTDVVILLDASGSMKSKYGIVREAAIEFTRTLSQTEHLHLRAFAGVPTVALEGSGDRVAAEVDRYLPPGVLPGGTDLGLAIEKGLDFLERPDSSQLAAFFLLTDGVHEPPSGSPYSRDFERDQDWLVLRRRAHSLCEHRRVLVYGLGLRQQTDLGLLRRVFPARYVELIVGGPSIIGDVLARMRERLRRDQLREALEQELRSGRVEVSLTPDSISGPARQMDAVLTLRNLYTRLSVRIATIHVERDNQGAQDIHCSLRSGQGSALLDPGKELRVPVRVEMSAQLPARHLGRAQWKGQAVFRMLPVVSFPDEGALRDLGLADVHPTVSPPSLRVDLRVSYGIPYWVLVLGFVVLLALVAVVLEVRRRKVREAEATARMREERKRLTGYLKIWSVGDNEPAGPGTDLSVHEASELLLCEKREAPPEIVKADRAAGEDILARFSGHLVPTGGEGQEERPEFHIDVGRTHRLACESRGQMREVSLALVLCDGDLFEIDGKWRLRYTNEQLPRRFELESAQ